MSDAVGESANLADLKTLYRVRKTVHQMLTSRGYVVNSVMMAESYQDFEQLYKNMTPSDRRINLRQTFPLKGQESEEDKGIHVIFAESKLTSKLCQGYVKDLEQLQLSRCIVIFNGKPNSMVLDTIRACEQRQPPIYLELFPEQELLVNITHHHLVPQHEVLTESQKQ